MDIININKYLEQKGGTSDARIEDDRQDNVLSFARVHPRTDIVLQIGQKYVFQKINQIDNSGVQKSNESIRFINELEHSFEELEYLGQKKIRMMEHLDSIGETDKRRPRVESVVRVDTRDPNLGIIFSQMHAFKKFTTGQVLMLNDFQVADHICL